MKLQVILNTFATDIFRKQADCDYIAARSNFRLQLRQQFLWAAQQSIEKYLKAILLFNGRSTRFPDGKEKGQEFGHNLNALLKEVEKIDIFQLDLDSEHKAFIEYLAQQGPNRYISVTAYSHGHVLPALDSTVWHLRRYCQFFPREPGRVEAYVAAASNPEYKLHPQKFHLQGGELEKILKRPTTDPARRALVWANLLYGSKKRNRVTYTTFSSTEVPPPEREWPNVNWAAVTKFIKP